MSHAWNIERDNILFYKVVDGIHVRVLYSEHICHIILCEKENISHFTPKSGFIPTSVHLKMLCNCYVNVVALCFMIFKINNVQWE